jgi:hypothetical protein
MGSLARLLAAVHLCVSAAHGVSHAALGIWPDAADGAFIATVVYAAPAAAILLARQRAAGFLLAAAMAGSLAFGIDRHFLSVSPDHVGMVPPGSWSEAFRATAAVSLLVDASALLAALWRR